MDQGYMLLLPDGVSDYFRVIGVDQEDSRTVIHLDELNAPPIEYLGEHLQSKGFIETALSYDELYTVVTNKAALGKQNSIVAIIKGTSADKVIEVLRKIPEIKRKKVKEVTLDMAANMQLIIRRSFVHAQIVIDRFHVQKLASEALQDVRIAHRWQAIEQENKEMELAKESKENYQPEILENGETRKQLLARSRYLLFKTENKWTPNQNQRAEVLFKWYPDIKQAYGLTMKLRYIYHTVKNKQIALTRLAQWYEEVEQTGFKQFQTVKRSIAAHYQYIINYFDNRSTNAAAESFNAKIKAFRRVLRGVNYIPYFLFRLKNIYA